MWDTEKAWQTTWQALNASPEPDLHERLILAYQEPHRSYHTLQHLEECFAKFNELRLLSDHPAEIELAIWFHDAVYDVKRHDNEEKSAEWACTSLSKAGSHTTTLNRVHHFILATKHKQPASDNDTAILTDVDLAILGAPADRFDEYEQQIAIEYWHVPVDIFTSRRRQFLEKLLVQPRIFSTLLFHARYEDQARANLRRTLERL